MVFINGCGGGRVGLRYTGGWRGGIWLHCMESGLEGQGGSQDGSMTGRATAATGRLNR
jgi:hypothetical protein